MALTRIPNARVEAHYCARDERDAHADAFPSPYLQSTEALEGQGFLVGATGFEGERNHQRNAVKPRQTWRRNAPLETVGGNSSGSVDEHLARALSDAACAGRFDVVAQLARELEARRLAKAENVISLAATRRRQQREA
jgi:hypothetical protein